jgi:L,D-transpeptidase ErfK/SrfK
MFEFTVKKLFSVTLLLASFSITISSVAMAATYLLPLNPNDSLIGENPDQPLFTQASKEDTLLDVARRYDLGQNEILLLNPEVDRWMPDSRAKIRIPNSRILPDVPREGLTLNLPEYRLFYFSRENTDTPQTVTTHPISIGRQDWDTPLGKTSVTSKKENPTWTPPKSIKEEHAAKGDILPDVVPAGPDNPLGLYAMRLGIPGYLIHGTNKPYGVGMRVSHGCIRMYPEDIEKLFPEVRIGLPVYIVNQPIKIGWLEAVLYIEVHPEMEGHELSYEQRQEKVLNLIKEAYSTQISAIDAAALRQALEQQNGIPTAISRRQQANKEQSLDEQLF